MRYLLFVLFLLSQFVTAKAQQAAIIPQPVKLTLFVDSPGFYINRNVVIVADKAFYVDATVLAAYLKDVTGINNSVENNNSKRSKAVIVIKQDKSGGIPKEGYRMEVSADKVEIRASDPAGAFYGSMSLLQSLTHNKQTNTFEVHAMQVEDSPRFLWRGLMLDCSRTFLKIEFLKKMIDRMSFYKLNTLHLHLTDDQGWRLHIKNFPLLTKKGASFAPWLNEPDEFQGFYTAEQMKDLVKYAQKRHIELVPEIECPGHSHAALYAYPEFSCENEVTPIFPALGPDQPVREFSPCKKGTYLFFKNVIQEVSDIFPSRYIHMGGDEVGHNAWKDCDDCKEMTDRLGIPHDTKSLQKVLMDSVGKYVRSENKKPIGWDEVFFEGVKDYTIQIWRGAGESLKEVQAGYDVIMSSQSNVYFDYSYETTPTKKVFAFEPVPDGVTEEQKKHYLGIEACFWSHIDRTQASMEYQLFPRLLALAERAWSRADNKDYEHFRRREMKQDFWLSHFKIFYNKSGF